MIKNPSETREGEIKAWYEVRDAGRSELKIWGLLGRPGKGIKKTGQELGNLKRS